jgi:hypothetical protein
VSTMLNWSCTMLMTGCPQDPPPPGTSCNKDGLVCDYGSCVGGERVKCTADAWVNDPSICAS